MGNTKADIPSEKTITLSSLMASKGGLDKPFPWESREFLRKLCIGKAYVRDLEMEEEEQRKLRMVELWKLMEEHVAKGIPTVKSHRQNYCIKVELRKLTEEHVAKGFPTVKSHW